MPTPTPSISIAPTEANPTQVTTPRAVPTVDTIQTHTAVTAAPTAPLPPPFPSATAMPPPALIPSPTPLVPMPVRTATDSSFGAMLGLMLAALTVAALAVFVLSRRPGG